jgi:hypothetical protein
MSGLGGLGLLSTSPCRDLTQNVHADVSGAGDALLLAHLLIGSPVRVFDADNAARGAFRSHGTNVADQPVTAHPPIHDRMVNDLPVTGHLRLGSNRAKAVNKPP